MTKEYTDMIRGYMPKGTKYYLAGIMELSEQQVNAYFQEQPDNAKAFNDVWVSIPLPLIYWKTIPTGSISLAELFRRLKEPN